MASSNSNEKNAWIEKKLQSMTLEQKVGQCFNIMWSGGLISRDIIEAITKLHVGALRLQPNWMSGKRETYYNFSTAGGAYDYPEGYEPIAEKTTSADLHAAFTATEYAEKLNRLQQFATESGAGIPLFMSIDQEGDVSRNFTYDATSFFPSAMGMTATGDPDLVYEAHKANARQLSAMGVTTIHSPVCDVNLNPKNPEIHIRSFGDDPRVAAEYALAAMRGLQDGGLVTVGKHFPGRGDSAVDAHYDTPVLDVDRTRMDNIELVPFKALIDNGLDSVMIAHNVYTCIDPDLIATVSSKVIKGLLREELGFTGVITTDAIAMGALIKAYSLPTACAMALEAGCDVVLNKTESVYRDQGILETIKFVKEGRISESDLDGKVRRLLGLKWDKGIIERKGQVDAPKASETLRTPEIIDVARKTAQKSTLVMKNDGALPVGKETPVLCIEQKIAAGKLGISSRLNRFTFTEKMLDHSIAIQPVDTDFMPTEKDTALVMDLAEKYDVIVATSFYDRLRNYSPDLLRALKEKGKTLIIVTNTPYEFSVVPEADAIICTFSATPECMEAAAGVIYGTVEAQGTWPLKKYHFE